MMPTDCKITELMVLKDGSSEILYSTVKSWLLDVQTGLWRPNTRVAGPVLLDPDNRTMWAAGLEGSNWIHGWHMPDSDEIKAMRATHESTSAYFLS